MTEFNYNPTITGRVIKTKEEQFDTFFYQGHPLFLIPKILCGLQMLLMLETKKLTKY
jgi:hypothetical protein